MSSLADTPIVLSKKGDAPMPAAEAEALLEQVPGWQIVSEDGVDKLTRDFRFKDYLVIIELAHKVGRIAEQNDHHPEMHVAWGKLTVTWWTHVTRGLHKNDFIMAARCNRAAMLVSAP